MNGGDVLRRCRELGIPTDAVAVNEMRDEAYVLEDVGTEWAVYYAERGLRSHERRFTSEDDAARYLLDRLRSAFGIC